MNIVGRPAFASLATRRRKHMGVFAGAVALLLMAACGGPESGHASAPRNAAPGAGTVTGQQGTASGSTANAAACNLFSKADVTAVLGDPVERVDGVDSTALSSSLCTYAFAADSKNATIAVTIYYDRKAMQLYLDSADAGTPVDGLGDQAYWLLATGTVFVRKGDHGLAIINPTALKSFDQSESESNAARDSLVKLAKLAGSKWY